MSRIRFRLRHRDERLEAGFRAIRTELDVPDGFPTDVLAEAEAVASRGPALPPDVATAERIDRRDIRFVAIDPPGSRDIDQAYAAERTTAGYRVHYAIADLGAFVEPGGALDVEARSRGVTLYSPDSRASLHPEAINEDAASLLADADRPAVLWTIELDRAGQLVDAHLQRATVRNRAAISYREAQEAIDRDRADESLALLATIGRRRTELETRRGAVSLDLPDQEVEHTDDSGYVLEYDRTLPVENWNAQISLLTGMAAARIMLDAGVGLLRTLPPADEHTIGATRRAARALGVGWADHVSYADRVRKLDPTEPREAALLFVAARSLRGAGYVAFHDGDIPDLHEHAAIAAPYAHVTAPLRRVCDRFANEVLLAICADREPPAWALDALDSLPETMQSARHRDRSLERTIVDFMEAAVLEHRVGEAFDGIVTTVRKGRATVQIGEPAVVAPVADDRLQPGDEVKLRLLAADLDRRQVTFEVVDG